MYPVQALTVGARLDRRKHRRAAIVAQEDGEDQPEDVEAGQSSGQNSHRIDNPPGRIGARLRRRQDSAQYRVFAPETGERHYRRQRQAADDEHPEGVREASAQPTHSAQVLLAVDGMDDGSSSKEEQRFIEGMSGQMEDTGAESARGFSHEHVGK